MSELVIFVRQVRSRSIENRKAIKLLATAGLTGQVVAVLRQELDSMVRVMYLILQPPSRRMELICASIQGERWSQSGTRAAVTDKEMVDLAAGFQGWTSAVYKMACAFIHLSNFHDYRDRDPLAQISASERRDILDYCRYYHGGPAEDATFVDLIPYLPEVFIKISDNLDCYIEGLENGLGQHLL